MVYFSPMTENRRSDIDTYYYYLNMITEYVRNRYDDRVLHYCELSLPLIPALIEHEISHTGEFDISTIPAIELGARLWALSGNEQKLNELQHLVASHPELAPWQLHIDKAFELLEEVEK